MPARGGPRRSGTNGTMGLGGGTRPNGRHPKIVVMVPTLGLKMLHGYHGIGLLHMMKVVVAVIGVHGRTRAGPPSTTIPGGSNKNGGRNPAKHHGPMKKVRNHPMDTM